MLEAVSGFFGAFFILGGFWFWVVSLGVFVAIVALADNEENIWAGIVVGVFIWAIMGFNNLSINWAMVPWFILGYLVLGALMSLIKWISYVKLRADRYADLKVDWAQDNNIPNILRNSNMKNELSDDQYKDFRHSLERKGFISSRERTIVPQPKKMQSTIVSWVLWWPAVMFWTLLNDPLRRIGYAIVRSMKTWYEGIARKAFANVGVDVNDE